MYLLNSTNLVFTYPGNRKKKLKKIPFPRKIQGPLLPGYRHLADTVKAVPPAALLLATISS